MFAGKGSKRRIKTGDDDAFKIKTAQQIESCISIYCQEEQFSLWTAVMRHCFYPLQVGKQEFLLNRLRALYKRGARGICRDIDRQYRSSSATDSGSRFYGGYL